MLTASSPYRGSNLVETLTKVVRYPTPSAREQRPDTPAALDRLCMAALAKDPADRPTTDAFAKQLDAIIASLPKPGDRGRRSAAVTVVGALALLAAGAVIGQRTAPRAPVAPAGMAAAPDAPPAAPRPPLGAGGLGAGDAGTLTFTGRAKMEQNKRGLAVDYSRKLVLDAKVVAADAHAVELACTVTRIAVHLAGSMSRPDYDSQDDATKTSAFREALGKTLTIVFDPGTGAITTTTGGPAIQKAIFARVASDRERMLFRVPELATEKGLKDALDPLLHVLPDEGEVPGWPWALKRALPSEYRERIGSDLALDLPVTVVETPEKQEVDLSWKGDREESGATHKVEGDATFGPRALVRARQHEEIRSEEGALVLDNELEQAWR